MLQCLCLSVLEYTLRYLYHACYTVLKPSNPFELGAGLMVMAGASTIKLPHFTLPPIQRVSDTSEPFLTVEFPEVEI